MATEDENPGTEGESSRSSDLTTSVEPVSESKNNWWDRWINGIEEDLNSDRPTRRTIGWIKRSCTGIVFYLIASAILATLVLIVDYQTPLVIMSKPYREWPALTGTFAAALFFTERAGWLPVGE